MKTRFTSIDIKVVVSEIMKSEAIGLRVMNVYDIDNKTYLIRVVHSDTKKVILIESGSRIHLTEYDWPKNMMPSNFSMKCRKHLKGRRLVSVKQLGVDRIVDFTFGYDEAAYHLIVELYDRGNIILTDYNYQILQLLRVRTDADKDVKYAVREIYPIENARCATGLVSRENLKLALEKSKHGDPLKRVLNSMFVYGQALVESCLLQAELQPNMKLLQQFDPNVDQDLDKLMSSLENAEMAFNAADSNHLKGYIIQKKDTRPIRHDNSDVENELLTYNEFHPILYHQHLHSSYIELPCFNKAVDEFFSKIESQKIDTKALQVEKAAIKRLENVRKDHEKRVDSLKYSQDADMKKAELIEMNLPNVESAIASINGAIANKIDWEEIEEIVNDAKLQHDPIASIIKSLDLSTNHIVVSLSDPCDIESSGEESDEIGNSPKAGNKTKIDVNIDLSLTAFANARNYHNKRRHAAQKEQKTLQASKKALKSAEHKTQETLKEVQTSKMISKTRKTNWFEKFYWFISSENYLVIGGRDQQQNELIVKRHLKPGDLYVHADLHGASSVILKNPTGGEVPPKTLNEAGTMAICYSAAWDARVVTSAWYVYHNQVSKTAPSGEYLTTGSFMIRGKKNYLPPSYLVMGFAVMFRLDESSIPNHLNDRRVKAIDTDITNEVSEVEEEVDLNDIEDINLVGTSIDSDGISYEGFSDVRDSNCEEINKGLAVITVNESISPILNPDDVYEKIDQICSDENEGEEIINFPDTNIELKHVTGESFQLYRGINSTSNQHGEDEDDDFIHLGDGQKISMKRQVPVSHKSGLSAKQRRDLKKKKKTQIDSNNDSQPVVHQEPKENIEVVHQEPKENIEARKEKQQEQIQLKRRQKSKQKKIRDKYKDQDEEDKELMQQILRSHEPKKTPKKKGKQKHQESKLPEKSKHINKPVEPVILYQPDGNPVIEGENLEQPDEEKDEEIDKESISLLDSLTGCPVPDDILLYAIPCCLPYSCLQSFKFKVKLTPGSGRRGKAAKTALHMFQTSKEASDWEKDLLKALKDADISRNIPGKVKVSAPNLQKSKKK